jgi:hypothetical protein
MFKGQYSSGEMSEGEYKQHKRSESIKINNLKDIKENLIIMNSDIQSLKRDMKLILSILKARDEKDEIPKGWFS